MLWLCSLYFHRLRQAYPFFLHQAYCCYVHFTPLSKLSAKHLVNSNFILPPFLYLMLCDLYRGDFGRYFSQGGVFNENQEDSTDGVVCMALEEDSSEWCYCRLLWRGPASRKIIKIFGSSWSWENMKGAVNFEKCSFKVSCLSVFEFVFCYFSCLTLYANLLPRYQLCLFSCLLFTSGNDSMCSEFNTHCVCVN